MKLLEQIEAMRARMTELATGEHAIVRTMGEALSAVDQRLLEDVRNVAAAHEARRGAILRELKCWQIAWARCPHRVNRSLLWKTLRSKSGRTGRIRFRNSFR